MEQLRETVVIIQRKPQERDLGGFFCTQMYRIRVLHLYYMTTRDDDEEVSSTGQYIYDSYSGLDVYGTEMDSDECEMPESMNDI